MCEKKGIFTDPLLLQRLWRKEVWAGTCRRTPLHLKEGKGQNNLSRLLQAFRRPSQYWYFWAKIKVDSFRLKKKWKERYAEAYVHLKIHTLFNPLCPYFWLPGTIDNATLDKNDDTHAVYRVMLACEKANSRFWTSFFGSSCLFDLLRAGCFSPTKGAPFIFR